MAENTATTLVQTFGNIADALNSVGIEGRMKPSEMPRLISENLVKKWEKILQLENTMPDVNSTCTLRLWHSNGITEDFTLQKGQNIVMQDAVAFKAVDGYFYAQPLDANEQTEVSFDHPQFADCDMLITYHPVLAYTLTISRPNISSGGTVKLTLQLKDRTERVINPLNSAQTIQDVDCMVIRIETTRSGIKWQNSHIDINGVGHQIPINYDYKVDLTQNTTLGISINWQ